VKKKEEKKTNVVICVETGTFTEHKPHPFHPVLPRFQRKALFSPPSDEQHIESHFHQCIANPVHTLVGDKIIGDGDDYMFQGALNLSANVTKKKFLSKVTAFRLNLTRIQMDMQLREEVSLKPFNTFGIDVRARFFAETLTEEDVIDLARNLQDIHLPLLILGGGSNILFTKDFPGTVMKISIKGIHIIKEDEDTVWVKADAGENWDEVVKFCVNNGWGGLENLSAIPGNAGASPVQNIGAYGVEMKDTFFELETFDLESKVKRIFSKEECGFGYRESIFKLRYKGRFIILNVTFRLLKKPDLHLDYGNIREELTLMTADHPGIADVREAICRIRSRKLPDPAMIGNAGSFFKNPVILPQQFENLKHSYPGIVSFPQDGKIKLAAAWIIEQCDWKGKRVGNAGVHSTQPLVLVNHGNATGIEIFNLSEEIRQSVYKKFGVILETEVNIV
jgi:UDP-N-acetylmuramate dehydrogenase